jgi:glyoxylase-like metal-dependent hydrolase (beta-lactamase superfamily II)
MTELEYPFKNLPDAGTSHEVAPGVRWLRMPLPMALDHINLYLIEDHDGWWIVDTGIKGKVTQEYWQTIFEDDLKNKPVKGVIVTHMHPDHVGQAGWLCDKFRVPLYMTYCEYYSAKSFSRVKTDDLSWQTESYYRGAGFDADKFAELKRGFGGYSSIVEPIPESFIRIKNGSQFKIAGRLWSVEVGSGHSPEHACLYCDELGVLISGDQVIPKITSNVSVMPSEPEANPLLDWLDSLQAFFKFPKDTLVLPAHNTPFIGLHARLEYLIEHHEDHLLALEEVCVKPKKAIELLPVLFKRELDSSQMTMAMGECVAHLNYLITLDRLERTIDGDGVYRYVSIDPTLEKRARPGKHHEVVVPIEV